MPERLIKLMAEADRNPWVMSMIVFFCSSFAGLATHLREGGTITGRQFLTAMLNSGMLGTIIFLMGYKTFSDNLPYLVAMSLLAGIGSASLMSFMVQLFKRRAAALVGVNMDEQGGNDGKG